MKMHANDGAMTSPSVPSDDTIRNPNTASTAAGQREQKGLGVALLQCACTQRRQHNPEHKVRALGGRAEPGRGGARGAAEAPAGTRLPVGIVPQWLAWPRDPSHPSGQVARVHEARKGEARRAEAKQSFSRTNQINS